MNRPSEPKGPLKAGEYWVWNGKRYELWGHTTAFDGEKLIELGE